MITTYGRKEIAVTMLFGIGAWALVGGFGLLFFEGVAGGSYPADGLIGRMAWVLVAGMALSCTALTSAALALRALAHADRVVHAQDPHRIRPA